MKFDWTVIFVPVSQKNISFQESVPFIGTSSFPHTHTLTQYTHNIYTYGKYILYSNLTVDNRKQQVIVTYRIPSDWLVILRFHVCANVPRIWYIPAIYLHTNARVYINECILYYYLYFIRVCDAMSVNHRMSDFNGGLLKL